MSPPDWLVPLLQQFPIVGIALGTVWLMVKWSDRRRYDDLAHEREKTNEFAGARTQKSSARGRYRPCGPKSRR